MKSEIVIGSRASRLAQIQAEQVKCFIEQEHPELSVRILPMKTTGDQILDQPLDEVGGKGLFVKELDAALLEGRIDLSVHSLKDVPMTLPEQLPLVAFSAREDPRDVLILPRGEENIDFTRPIGCSSKRRMVQFAQLYPQSCFAPVRGNVETRIRKLDEGQYGALILAAAGLIRLGLADRISRFFSVEEMIPAAGQGILAVQGRFGEDYAYLDGYGDTAAECCATAERTFVSAIDGGCTTPTAAYAEIRGEQLTLHALYLDEEKGYLHRETITGESACPKRLGEEMAGLF